MALWNCLYAQPPKIKIDVTGIPLNQVFFELRDKYGLEFTFNDQLLAGYSVTCSREFETREEAVSYLLKGLPFSYEKNGKVFVIFSSRPITKEASKLIKVGGQVVEAGTFEPLPFSYIFINNKQVQADQNGNFNLLASADAKLNIQISHLGYFVYDTIFSQSFNRKFLLTPSVTELKEVKIEGLTIEKSTMIGDVPGTISVNHTIAPYLPGYGDNSVYNVLRLLPGLLASGEQASDPLVWGSYEGQTKIEFDGFTIFGLKSHSDDIGVVNPLLAKAIRIQKGGYGASFDDRVGGIVQITGKNGNLFKPSITLNINSSTVNALGELPLNKRSSILASFRKTYYELYNPAKLGFNGNSAMGTGNSGHNMDQSTENMVDVLVVPDYKFNDFNLKYTFRGDKKETVSAGLYIGGDRFGYNVDGNYNNHQVNNNLFEKNKQIGSSLQFSKPLGGTHNLQLKINYSSLKNSSLENNAMTNSMHEMPGHSMKELSNANKVSEAGAELTDNFSIFAENNFETGIGWQANQVLFSQTSNNIDEIAVNTTSHKWFAFLQNSISAGRKLKITPGVRTIYENLSNDFYIDPRISVKFTFSEPLKIYASWGKYHQFLSKMSFVDENLNYSYYWLNSDGKSYPVQASAHYVGGISFCRNDFLFSAEGYYKNTTGLTRFFKGSGEIEKGFYSGIGRSYGIDLYVKKEYKKNIAWIAYSLSKADENLSFDTPGLYRPAPQDQRHELKVAAIYNLKSFYFSTNYVYGSGFEILRNYATGNSAGPSYKRFDAGVVYKFATKRIFGDIGLSVLNVFNRQNIKYDNLKRVETGVSDFANIYSGALPFSPTIFLKVQL